MPLMAKTRADLTDGVGADRHKNPVVSFQPEVALQAVASRKRRGV
jgi:hypothetical protein